MSTLARTTLLALLAGPLLAADAAVAGPPASPAAARDVELRLAISPLVWDTGTQPQLDLRFVNHRAGRVRVVSPLDGSWDGARSPTYTLELIDASGAVVPEAMGPALGRSCGLTNPLHAADDILSLGPGAEVSATSSPNSFPYVGGVAEAARPGEYRARVRYRAEVPGATALDLVSNPVAVQIRGGDLALWTCRREQQQRLAAGYRYTTTTPLDLTPTADGAALLYKQAEVAVRPGQQQRTGVLYLQRLVGGPRGGALGLAFDDGLALARGLAIDDGVLALYTVDGRVDGVGPEHLRGVRVRGSGDAWTASALPGWTRELASAYSLGLARSGDRLGALYLTRGATPETHALHYQPIDRTSGEKLGEPQRLAAADYISSIQLVGDAQGLWATWSEAGKIHVRSLAAGSKPVVIPERLGSLDALWPRAGGFAIAYQKNSTDGRIPGDVMAYYLQNFDAAGARQGSPSAMTPTSATDPHWGELAWGDGGAARAYVERRITRSGRQQEPSDLRFGPLASDARKVSETLLGEPELAAVGDEFVLAWSDARDDRSKACLRLGDCVGEVYVASWKRGDRPSLAPTRVTQLAVPRPSVGPDHRWRELCDK